MTKYTVTIERKTPSLNQAKTEVIQSFTADNTEVFCDFLYAMFQLRDISQYTEHDTIILSNDTCSLHFNKNYEIKKFISRTEIREYNIGKLYSINDQQFLVMTYNIKTGYKYNQNFKVKREKYVMSEVHKAKIKESRKGKKSPWTPERRELMRLAQQKRRLKEKNNG